MRKLLLALCLCVGCVSTNWYTRVDTLTLVREQVTENSPFRTHYFTLANPTSSRLHCTVWCCEKSNCEVSKTTVHVAVDPRSDLRVRLTQLPDLDSETICGADRDASPVL